MSSPRRFRLDDILALAEAHSMLHVQRQFHLIRSPYPQETAATIEGQTVRVREQAGGYDASVPFVVRRAA